MRTAQDVPQVWSYLFPRFKNSSVTLQGQIHEMVVHSILSGLIPAGAPVPPSRALARALGVSRTTVSLALQSLVGKGFLVSRPRSGLYVNAEILLGQAGAAPTLHEEGPELDWESRFVSPELAHQRSISKPPNWQSFPYPFIYGQFDASLMPLRDWRACSNQALLKPAVRQWSHDLIDGDSVALVEQIQDRLLTARGIAARRDEILVTTGAQLAIYLLAQVLVDADTVVGVEEPGYPDARNSFKLRTDKVRTLPIDADGLIAGRAFRECRYVFTTPSHQCPTTVTMPMERRLALLRLANKHDVVLFEDDHESELNFSGKPLPALKSLDTHSRVIYLGSLSKTLAHSLRVGYVVGPASLIRELRRLRRLVLRHPPNNNAHAVALFVARGYHGAFLRRLNAVYRERRRLLAEALQRHLPEVSVTPSQGGSAAWVEGRRGLDSVDLARRALKRGIIVEPGGVFFAQESAANQRFFRMGYSAIVDNMIEAGVERLREVMDAT